jgi:hypothetical protein
LVTRPAREVATFDKTQWTLRQRIWTSVNCSVLFSVELHLCWVFTSRGISLHRSSRLFWWGYKDHHKSLFSFGACGRITSTHFEVRLHYMTCFEQWNDWKWCFPLSGSFIFFLSFFLCFFLSFFLYFFLSLSLSFISLSSLY